MALARLVSQLVTVEAHESRFRAREEGGKHEQNNQQADQGRLVERRRPKEGHLQVSWIQTASVQQDVIRAVKNALSQCPSFWPNISSQDNAAAEIRQAQGGETPKGRDSRHVCRASRERIGRRAKCRTRSRRAVIARICAQDAARPDRRRRTNRMRWLTSGPAKPAPVTPISSFSVVSSGANS